MFKIFQNLRISVLFIGLVCASLPLNAVTHRVQFVNPPVMQNLIMQVMKQNFRQNNPNLYQDLLNFYNVNLANPANSLDAVSYDNLLNKFKTLEPINFAYAIPAARAIECAIMQRYDSIVYVVGSYVQNKVYFLLVFVKVGLSRVGTIFH